MAKQQLHLRRHCFGIAPKDILEALACLTGDQRHHKSRASKTACQTLHDSDKQCCMALDLINARARQNGNQWRASGRKVVPKLAT